MGGVVEIYTQTPVVEIRGGERVVEVHARGLRGATGADGGAAGAYTHTQSVAATTWTINHDLGYRPSVELLTAGGVEFDGDVQHPTVNQTVVTLNFALAGTARLT